ncbi:hypothetical protein HNR60_002032 [Rhodopseudomonas rhenobacensis]|uniref:Uncharacterized protein n=1 Tax=Rhodopseudomonas rhenobacensis TaxID=87461 RepID=A0A7W7Z3R2_9BRAD|nr:hypothetical protein [Rhodopseudomonas rhenobacensis]MBB5047278.1 hypothetical protein [Rhodopseudomonas rhenobacensis]
MDLSDKRKSVHAVNAAVAGIRLVAGTGSPHPHAPVKIACRTLLSAAIDMCSAEVPELSIVGDELRQAVKTRQREITDKYVNVIEAVREAHSNRLVDIPDTLPNVSNLYRKKGRATD